MGYARNQIVFYGMKSSKSLQRSIEKQVEKWISREHSLLSLPKDSWYRVRIEKELNFPIVNCQLRIQMGSRTVESQETGKNVQEALLLAIRRLRTPWIEIRPQSDYFKHAENAA